MINKNIDQEFSSCITLIDFLLNAFIFIPFYNLLFFAFLAIIIVYITILTHACCVQFVMWTVPRFLSSAIFVITIIAHSFCIMNFVIVPAFVFLFTIL